MNKIITFFKRSAFLFVIINLLVAGIGFVRSLVYMKFLNFEELGILTMVTTTASLLAFFQIGLINGGYRIVALKEEKAIEKTNNNIISFLLLVSILVFLITIILVLLKKVDYKIGFISIFVGTVSLFNNWLTNRLIGSGNLRKLNTANLISNLFALFCLVLVYFYGFIGALISMLVQPILFLLFSADKNFSFTKFEIDIKHIKYILSFGFIPFISGIFFLLYTQIERWSVSFLLGNEALGKMYLFFIVVTLWVLIPNSIDNIFFPKAVKEFADRNIDVFKGLIRRYFVIILIYNILAVFVTFLLLDFFVVLFFEKYLPYVYLVYLSLIGLVIRSAINPINLFFNSIVQLRPIFLSDLIALIVYCVGVVVFYQFDCISLVSFVILFNIYFVSKFLCSILFFVILKSTIK